MALSAPGLEVDEGDKLDIEGEDGVYVIDWIGITVTAKPAGSTLCFDGEIEFEKDELAEKIDAGEVTVLNEDAPVTPAGQEIRKHIDIEALADALEGRSGLRVSKPDADGLTQFVWRMARFHGGYDTCMPVTAHSWLQQYLDNHDLDASVSGVKDDAGDEVLDQLEKAVDAVLVAFDENPARGAKRWEKAGAF